MITLPDWYKGVLAPETTLSPKHVKLSLVALPALYKNLTYFVVTDEIPSDQIWQIHKVWLAKSHTQLARLDLAWPMKPVTEQRPGYAYVIINGVMYEYMIIHRALGYVRAELDLLKGIDYHPTCRVLVFVRYYKDIPAEHYINANGIVKII